VLRLPLFGNPRIWYAPAGKPLPNIAAIRWDIDNLSVPAAMPDPTPHLYAP